MVFSSFSTCWKSTKARQPLATGHCSFGAQCSSPSVSKGSFRKEQFRIKHHQIIPLPLRKMHTSNIKHHYGNHWFIKHHPNIMEFIASSVPISEKEFSSPGNQPARQVASPDWSISMISREGYPKKKWLIWCPICVGEITHWLFWVRSSPLDLTLWLWLTVRHGIRWLIYRGLPIKNSDFPWLC